MNWANALMFLRISPRSFFVCEMSFQCLALVNEGGVTSENLPLPSRVTSALIDSAVVSSVLVSTLTLILKLPTSPLKSEGGFGGRGSISS